MKQNMISVLGYVTESITPNRLLEDVQLAGMPRSEQLRLLLKRTWKTYLSIAVLCVIVIPGILIYMQMIVGRENRAITFSDPLLLGLALMMLLLFLITGAFANFYMPDRNKIVKSIGEAYKAFARDLIAIGGYEITRHEEEFLPRTQEWLNSDDEAKAFIQKIKAVRAIPELTPILKETVEKNDAWDSYKKAFDYFDALSSFVSKLAL